MPGSIAEWGPGDIRVGLSIRIGTDRVDGLRDKVIAAPAPGSQPSRDSQVSWLSDSTRLSRTESIFSVATPRLSRSSCRQSSVDSEPVSAISPWGTDQRKDSLDADNRYFCTFCDRSFASKTEWRSHEAASHGDSKEYSCRECGASYSLLTSLSSHLQQAHGSGPPSTASPVLEPSGARRIWACGFGCVYASVSHGDYLDHISNHFDDGKERVQWQYISVIKALLHQPGLRDSWEHLVKEQEAEKGSKLRFSWDDRISLVLQSMLERFVIGQVDPRVLTTFAFNAAQVKAEANVSGQYTTDGRVSQVHHATPAPEGPTTSRNCLRSAEQGASPATDGPDLVMTSFQALSMSNSVSFSSRNAKRSNATGPIKVLVKIDETAPSQPSPAPDLDPQRSLHGRFTLGTPKKGLLRRVESDWNLGLSKVGEEEIARPRTAMATRPSVSVTTNIDNRSATSTSIVPTSCELTPDSQALCEDWLMVTRSKTMEPKSSGRSRSGSSFVSSPVDHRHVDNSTTASDDTFSEPDLWLNSSDNSDAARIWAHALHHTLDSLMRSIWTKYNRGWDSLIHKCVGEQGAGHIQVGDFAGLSQSSTSWYTGHRGLAPNIRRNGEDRDDDDDLEGFRPPSSQSKSSSSAPKRYACPFRKRDPVTYNIHDHDICALRSWESVSRMKEHLYRKHCKIHCQRCKQVFRKASDLAAHSMLPDSCPIRDGNGPADISAQQELQLKSKKYASRYQSEETKWAEVFGILFPGEQAPSPYPELAPDIRPPSAESHNSLTFQHFLVSEMPQIFRQTAESHYRRPVEGHDSLTMDSISFILGEAVSKAFQEWEGRGNVIPRHVTPNSLILESTVDPSPSLPNVTPDMSQYDASRADMTQFIPEELLVGDFQPQPPPHAYWVPSDTLGYGAEVPQPPTGDAELVNALTLDPQSFDMVSFQHNYNSGSWV